ncbi:MAG: PAS domain S-box protein [Gemmatimonadota bacterium]
MSEDEPTREVSQAEAAAGRAGEPRYRQFVETANEGVWVLDASGLTEYVNTKMAELLGYAPHEMRGRPFVDFVPSDDRALAEEALQRRRRGIVERYDLRLRRRDGSRLWVLAATNPLRGEDGDVAGALMWITDISGRRRVERLLRRRARQRAAVAELGQRTLMGAELRQLMDEASGLIARILEVEMSAVWELLPAGEALRLRAGVGWKPGMVGRATVGSGVASHPGFTIGCGEPVVIESLLSERRFPSSLLREHEVLTGAGVIIFGRPGPWGVLAGYSTRHRAFDEDELSFLISVANILATAIERLRTETRLRASHERLELLSRGTSAVFWDRDLETGKVWMSMAFHTHFGYPPAECEPSFEQWASLVHDDDRERVSAGIDRLMAGEDRFWSDQYRFRRADDTYVEVSDHGCVVRDPAGRPIRALGAMLDLTMRRELARRRALPGTGSKTILLVADDASVRSVARRILESDGYAVVEAEGRRALQLAEGHAGPLHLVLVDAALAQASGPELAEQLLRRRPGLEVIYLAGCTDGELLRRAVPETELRRIEKPFTSDALLRAVRGALGNAP